jgi:hypothetical protein
MSDRDRSKRGGVWSFVLCIICIVTIDFFNPYMHLLHTGNTIGFSPPKSGLSSQNLDTKEARQHKVAGLSCKAYGGPSDEDAAEMVYWRDIPVDASFVSPFKRKEEQYLTFEPGTLMI